MYGTHPYLRLAVIYLAVFALWHLLNALLFGWPAALPCGIEEWLAVAILYVLGIAFCLANYTCIEGESPSMILFTLLDEAEPEGCDREAVVRGFGELGHVEDRLGTMEERGMLRRNADGSFSATRRGKFIRWCFDAIFRPLGRERENGD